MRNLALAALVCAAVAVAGDRYVGTLTVTSASVSSATTAAPFTAPKWGAIQCDNDFRFRTASDGGLASATDTYVGPASGYATRLWDYKLAAGETTIAVIGADGGARSCTVTATEF